jgi:hypothetical protein
MVRQLPAQSLYMVMKDQGLSAAAEIFGMATVEQCRLFLDFDAWRGDSLSEESLWDWLGLTDEGDSLELLQKLLKCIDLRLLAILIDRYVEVRVFDDAADQPPGEGFHTPDKGYTWVGIKTEDPHQHFLLARLLALIFESSAELFYQLLATPSVATSSMLEEEAYQDREKRLAAEGVPCAESTAMVHAPLSLAEACSEVQAGARRAVIEDVRSVEPLVYESRSTRLFAELFRRLPDRDGVELEFSYLMNAAVVRWKVDFCDQERVVLLAEKVKGAINIGLERMVSEGRLSLVEVYEGLGLAKLYRLGLTELMALRRKAQRIPTKVLEALAPSGGGSAGAAAEGQGARGASADLPELAATNDSAALGSDRAVLFSVVAHVMEAFPGLPIFLSDDGTVQDDRGALPPGQRPFESTRAIATVHAILDRLV